MATYLASWIGYEAYDTLLKSKFLKDKSTSKRKLRLEIVHNTILHNVHSKGVTLQHITVAWKLIVEELGLSQPSIAYFCTLMDRHIPIQHHIIAIGKVLTDYYLMTPLFMELCLFYTDNNNLFEYPIVACLGLGITKEIHMDTFFLFIQSIARLTPTLAKSIYTICSDDNIISSKNSTAEYETLLVNICRLKPYQSSLVDLLLKKKVNPDPAFLYVCMNDHIELVHLLLKHVIALQNVFRVICVSGKTNIVQIMLDAGVDPKSPYAFQDACASGQADTVRLLLDNGVNPGSQRGFRKACIFGMGNVVQMLLEEWVDPTSQYAFKKACKYGKAQIVQLLLEEGIDPRTQDAFREACAYGWTEIVQLLVTAGVDPNSQFAFQIACRTGNQQVVQLLLEMGVSPSSQLAFQGACVRGKIDIVHLLLVAGVNPNSQLAFQKARVYGNTDIMRLLIHAGAIQTPIVEYVSKK